MTTRLPAMRLVTSLVLVAELATALPAPAAPAATPPASGAARATTTPLLRRAQSLYAQARYDEAVTALFGPVSRGELKGAELRDARVIMARCYVKKGLNARAKDLFATVVADDPTFVLDATRADAEELAVFNEVKPPATPAGPQGAQGQTGAQPTEKPKLHKPDIGPSPDKGPGWLSRHKLLAATLALGAGTGAVLLASSGGGGDNAPKRPGALPNFPDPPSSPGP